MRELQRVALSGLRQFELSVSEQLQQEGVRQRPTGPGRAVRYDLLLHRQVQRHGDEAEIVGEFFHQYICCIILGLCGGIRITAIL